MERKLASLEEVDSSVLQTGWAKVEGLRLDDELYNQDLEKWLKNLEVAVGIREKLAGVRPRYLDRLGKITADLNFESSAESKFIQTLPPESQFMVRCFIKSDAGAEILKTVKATSRSNSRYKEFQTSLAGAIFEQLAYEHIRPTYNHPNFTLLSPQEVFNLYHYLFPERPVIENGGFTRGIAHTSFPDGLLIEYSDNTLCVRKIFEYKSWVIIPDQVKNYVQNYRFKSREVLQFDLTGQGKSSFERRPDPGLFLHSIRPQIPAGATLTIDENLPLVYVLPSNSEVSFPDTDNVFAPISTGSLWNLTMHLRSYCKS